MNFSTCKVVWTVRLPIMSYQINHMSHNYESLRRNRKNTEAANEKKITSRFPETDLFWFLFKGGLASILWWVDCWRMGLKSTRSMRIMIGQSDLFCLDLIHWISWISNINTMNRRIWLDSRIITSHHICHCMIQIRLFSNIWLDWSRRWLTWPRLTHTRHYLESIKNRNW